MTRGIDSASTAGATPAALNVHKFPGGQDYSMAAAKITHRWTEKVVIFPIRPVTFPGLYLYQRKY